MDRLRMFLHIGEISDKKINTDSEVVSAWLILRMTNHFQFNISYRFLFLLVFLKLRYERQQFAVLHKNILKNRNHLKNNLRTPLRLWQQYKYQCITLRLLILRNLCCKFIPVRVPTFWLSNCCVYVWHGSAFTSTSDKPAFSATPSLILVCPNFNKCCALLLEN